MTSKEIQVPAKYLADSPSVGDEVIIEITGKLKQVDGNMATITITEIEGETLDQESQENEGDESGETTGDTPPAKKSAMDTLRDQASQYDAQQGME